MAKHKKDWNTTPTDPNASPKQKADEFEKQWQQNKDDNPSRTPALDSYERRNKK